MGSEADFSDTGETKMITDAIVRCIVQDLIAGEGLKRLVFACAIACACSPADQKVASATDTIPTTGTASPEPDTSVQPPKPQPSQPPLPSANWIVTAEGIGPVKAGMTIAEANSAVGNSLDLPSALQECDYTRTKNAPTGVGFMIEKGRIVRADVRNNNEVKTAEGAGIGDTEATIMSLYPGQVTVRPAKYTSGHSLLVTPLTGARDTRIVFETDGKTVTQFRSGMLPAVEYVEGCG